MHLATVACDINVPVSPGYINSDLIENWFTQMRSPQNGANNHPTLKQIGPSINSNIITGSVISKQESHEAYGTEVSEIYIILPYIFEFLKIPLT